MLYAAALARFLNLPRSLGPVTDMVFREGPPAWGKIKRRLRALHKTGTVFNAAYMVRGNDGSDKIESVVEHNVRPLVKSPPAVDPSSMERTHAALEARYGFGSFMAGQVVADLRWAIRGRWADRGAWAPVGPGSARGLGRLYHGDDWATAASHYVSDPASFLDGLASVMTLGRARLPASVTDRLEAMDYQNCLCEFDKYERARRGEGRPKQLYRPGEGRTLWG
jgi:hypothetical protein